MLKIKSIDKNSIGEELGLKIGDEVLEFDRFKVVDILDYWYYDSTDSFLMTVKRKDKVYEYEIEKTDDESLGLTFVSDGLETKTCHNNCIFCFVAQLPKGMRDSLYVKDDDYRLSFICGNYVTLTNVSDWEVERIIRLGLSPMYISVHSLVKGQREMMLQNRFADKLYEILQKFDQGGIEVHAQIVLCKDINDGDNLYQTCKKLSMLNNIKTLAIVPCGLSMHREGLTKIQDIDGEYAKKLINQVNQMNVEFNRTFIYPADDFYIRANLPFPDYEYYGEFAQFENGVGMFTSFMYEFNETARKSTYSHTFLIVTGVAAKSFIEEYAKKAENFIKGLKVNVIAPINTFFGETITCSGLLTGGDVCRNILNFKGEYDTVLLPKNMMKETENVFLDGMTLSQLSKTIQKPVKLVENSGAHFFNVLAGKE